MAKFTVAPTLSKVPRIDGARIAVIVEHKFIPDEIAAYLTCFPLLGAKVELVSRIWWDDHNKPKSAVFYSDVDSTDEQPWETPDSVEVSCDVSTVEPSQYNAIIMAANYTSVRMRYPGELPPDGEFDAFAHVQSAPLVKFFAKRVFYRNLAQNREPWHWDTRWNANPIFRT